MSKRDKHDIHELKISPIYFDLVSHYKKRFEVRLNDRDYKVGDTLILKEWDDINKIYTGRVFHTCINYILNDEKYCKNGYVILSI